MMSTIYRVALILTILFFVLHRLAVRSVHEVMIPVAAPYVASVTPNTLKIEDTIAGNGDYSPFEVGDAGQVYIRVRNK